MTDRLNRKVNLVVVDNPETRKVISLLLRKEGLYPVDIAKWDDSEKLKKICGEVIDTVYEDCDGSGQLDELQSRQSEKIRKVLVYVPGNLCIPMEVISKFEELLPVDRGMPRRLMQLVQGQA
jgi:CheY-like chemotaxis protein